MAQDATRVQRRRQATRERIFRAAIALFRARGFENVTVAEITEAADIGKGTFFTYFPTKEAVLAYLGEQLVEMMAAAVTAVAAGGMPAERLVERLFLDAVAWHEANHLLTEQVVLAGLRHAAALDADAGNRSRLLTLLAQIVRYGQEQGEFTHEILPEDGALVLGGVYFSVLMAWLRDGGARPLKERMLATVAIALRGLRP